MAKNINWTQQNLKDKGIAQNSEGVYVPVKSLVAKNIKKLRDLMAELGDTSNKVSVNKKVRNATKVEADGVKFDSRLEKTMYDLLRGAGIEFEFQKVYTLQEKFRYGTDAVRAISCRADFWLPDYTLLIDTKGYANDVSPLKYKMLKKLLHEQFEAGYYPILPRIYMPKNKDDCEAVIMRIKVGMISKNLP